MLYKISGSQHHCAYSHSIFTQLLRESALIRYFTSKSMLVDCRLSNIPGKKLEIFCPDGGFVRGGHRLIRDKS